MAKTSRWSAERRAWLITWLAAILPLLGWWMYGLFDIDEGFYGAVAAEMNRRGEWITPYYNGHPWFEKPILLYWFTKPSLALFGVWIGPRLPSVLATVGTYLLVAWFVRRHRDASTARWAVLILASSLLVVGLGRMLMTDALLNLCLCGTFLCLWESLVGDRRWRLMSAFFLGLSVLAKGPVGLILFVPLAAWIYGREPDLRRKFQGAWLGSIAIFAFTVAIWYLPAYLANGHDFVQKFLIEQNLNRFTGGDQAHNTPLWSYPIYYPLVIVVGMLPWSLFALKAWRSERDPLQRYLWTWILVPLVFFSLSKAKLPHYILPCCAPLAILLAMHFRQTAVRFSAVRELRMPVLACVMVAAIVNAAFLYYYSLFHREVHQLAMHVLRIAAPGDAVATYQLGRQPGIPSTPIKVLGFDARLNETDHPSLILYLGRVVPARQSINELLSDPNAQWIITRTNRVGPSEIAQAHANGRELTLQPQLPGSLYALFRLSPAPGERMRR